MFKPSFLSEEYLVSDEGYVLNKKGTQPLKPSINHNGYEIVQLAINGQTKGVSVHTLVARAFCDGYEQGLCVNHKDGNKRNNKATNLEWVTIKENNRHALYELNQIANRLGKNNANSRQICAIDKDNNILYFTSVIEAAQQIKPDAPYNKQRAVQNCIVNALKGRRKTYRGYIWKYI